jgi:hypothetical protein
MNEPKSPEGVVLVIGDQEIPCMVLYVGDEIKGGVPYHIWEAMPETKPQIMGGKVQMRIKTLPAFTSIKLSGDW